MGFGADGMDDPIVTPGDGGPRPTGYDVMESPLDENVLAEGAEPGTAEIPVYSFGSFDELKAAVEAAPPTHDAHGLYNFVQARLQRPGTFVTSTPEDIERMWQIGNEPGSYSSPTYTREVFDGMVAKERAEYDWLKQAIVRLEARAFGPIRQGPALGTYVTCVYGGELLYARVEAQGWLPGGKETLFYTDVHRDGTHLVFRGDLQGKRWLSGRHDFNSAEAQALLVASADPSLPPNEFWTGRGRREQQFDSRESALAVAHAQNHLAAVLAFEADWDGQMGGPATVDLRSMIGIAMSQLVVKYGVQPHVLADYLREALRLNAPNAFDKPTP